MLRIGALISGGGTNLTAIVNACKDRRIDGAVMWVGADTPQAAGLEKARSSGIETFVVDYGAILQSARSDPSRIQAPDDFRLDQALDRQRLFAPDADPARVERFLLTRAAAEAQLLAQIARAEVDLLVLAGFMRTLSPYFIDRFNKDPQKPRIMNIHPALLPAFPGIDGYGDTFRYGCKVGGCTVHFVDYGEDTGPIIGQRAFSIQEDDTLESVRKKGLQMEWSLYPACIRYFAQGRLQVEKAAHRRADGTVYHRKRVRILPKNSG